jgi:hypothetical protein
VNVCGGLDIWSVRMKKTGCHVVESLRLLVPRVEVGAGRYGLNVKTDLRSLGMKKEWAQYRVEWRRLVGGNRQPLQAR